MADYRAAGVDIEEGARAAAGYAPLAAATQGPEVLGGIGGFASLYALSGFREPVLVSGTDGVGTKVEVARAYGILDTIGVDLVAMCVNDVLCAGARPLFFLDYLAVDRLDAAEAARIVGGVAAGCREAGCALVGGETAEMPGVYRAGRFDLAGFAVGAVERSEVIDGSALRPGMVIVGLASSGVHANGFSLVRRVIDGLDEGRADEALARALLTPTRIYAQVIAELMKRTRPAGIAHVTGGGWPENLPRMVGGRGDELHLVVRRSALAVPAIFDEIAGRGVDRDEMYRTFNMGLGMAVALAPAAADEACAIAAGAGIEAAVIGEVVAGAAPGGASGRATPGIVIV